MKKILTLAFILVLCLSMFTLLPVHSAGMMGPYPDELYYVVYPDTKDAVLALETGAVDMCTIATPEQASELASQGFSERFARYAGGDDPSFNFNHDLCNDKAFRQALAHLAPVDEVLAQYIYPLGARKHAFCGPAFAPWTTEEGLHVYDFDPEKAAEILDAAGYRVHPDGTVRTYPNGTKLRQISVMWSPGAPSEHLYERWADQMEALKIPVKREPVTFDTLFYRVYIGDFDVVEIGWGYTPRADVLQLFASDRGALSWVTNWHNATFEAYIDIIMTSINETEVQEATADALRLMTEELPYVPFYEPVYAVAFKPSLRGIIEDMYLPWSLLRMQWATPGGIVKYTIGQPPQTLNPLTSLTNLDAWLARIFDGVFGMGLLAADPWTGLASIKYACNRFDQELTGDGGMKITIELRHGMYWHDGVEATAADVKFCLEYIFNTGAPTHAAAVMNFINATLIDTYTVALYYSKPSLWTKYNVAFCALTAPKHIWNNDTSIYGEPAGLPGIQSGYAYGVGDPINFRPELMPYPGRETEFTCLIGSGAYIFRPDSWHGDEYIKLYANRNYHRRPLLTDTNFDFKIDIRDIFTAAKAFGTEPGHPRWNAIADIDNSEKIDIRDIYFMARDFGKTW